MKIERFIFNPFDVNCYLCYDNNTKEGLLIDPSFYTSNEKELFTNFIENANIHIKYIINTHGHIDHILGNQWICDLLNLPFHINKNDFFLINNLKSRADTYGLKVNSLENNKYIFIESDFKFFIGNFTFKIIETPGHSPGSICIVNEEKKIIFCGDTIFKNSIGRTDLPGGNYETLLHSIKLKLLKNYPDDYVLYPGHMEFTNIGYEKSNNPFLQ